MISRHARPCVSSNLNASGWHGNYRELQSLHFFSTISAPELAGYVDGAFWQTYLLEMTLRDDAVKHAVAALGAHHEYRLRQQASRNCGETEALWRFALRQYNKAIRLLVQRKVGMAADDVLRMLTVSLLFICFESMAGRKDNVLAHIIFARQLTKDAKKGVFDHDGKTKIQFRIVEQLVGHYDSQLPQFKPDKDAENMWQRLDIIEPIIIELLADARMSLLQGISRLSEILLHVAPRHDADKERRGMLAWFNRWERAFADFTSRNQGCMDHQDRIHANLLLSHWHAVHSISAVDSAKGEDAWAAMTPDYARIIDLATSILESHPPRKISAQAPQTPYFSSTMTLTEPLYICASRCVDPEIAAKAVQLLRRLPPSEGAKSQFRIAFLERHLRSATGKTNNPFDSLEEEMKSLDMTLL